MHQTLKDTHIIKEYPDILFKIFATIALTNTYVHSFPQYTKDKNSNVKNSIKKEKKKQTHSKWNIIKACKNSITDTI